MAIQVKDSIEFQRVLEAIALELVDANIAFRMHTDLIAAYEQEFGTELRQSWTFWSLTIQGHLDSAVFRLCRIYDQDDKNLGLRGLLETIRSNPHLFSKEHFSKRMQGRPAAEELVADLAQLDHKELERDLAYVSRSSNPLVDRLIDVRHNYYSHRNARDVVEDREVAEAHPHMREEVGELLRGGMGIVNRYSMLFHAQSWSTQIVGRDDFYYVLRSIRQSLEAHRAEIERKTGR
ncbi:MAG: hypothetical protein JWN63_240 [Candidatus Acidoferrum typicum]|nr:hypothetical protein [Candidatus Acidoferrum typicum]